MFAKFLKFMRIYNETFFLYDDDGNLNRFIDYKRLETSLKLKNKLSHKNPNEMSTIDKKSKKEYGPFVSKNEAELLAKSLIQKKHINQFFLFKSGKKLNKNGQLKIKEIVNQLDKKFKNKINLDIHLNEDRVIYYS